MVATLTRVLRALLRERYLPIVVQGGWFAHLAGCLQPARRGRGPADLAPLLERIAEYQQATGRAAALPKSLRKRCEGHERRLAERRHLGHLAAQGRLTPAARLRWQHLQQPDRTDRGTGALRRAAEEAYLCLGLDALSLQTLHRAEAICHRHLAPLLAHLEPHRLWKFALWIQRMTVAEQARLARLMDAWSAAGGQYKRRLPENQAWIAQAQARGVGLRPWFAAEVCREVINGQAIQIGLAANLAQLFRMGDYFQTCLRLGGENEKSVLTNACDANKQVVLAWVQDGQGRCRVVARKLLAISRRFELLGYNCYYHGSRHTHDKVQALVDAVAAYCGRLAAECGLPLGDQGEPEKLADCFWLDDGVDPWSDAARAAHTAQQAQAACQVQVASGGWHQLLSGGPLPELVTVV